MARCCLSSRIQIVFSPMETNRWSFVVTERPNAWRCTRSTLGKKAPKEENEGAISRWESLSRKCSSTIQFDVYRRSNVSPIRISRHSILSIFLFRRPLLYLWSKREPSDSTEVNVTMFIVMSDIHTCTYIFSLSPFPNWYLFFCFSWIVPNLQELLFLCSSFRSFVQWMLSPQACSPSFMFYDVWIELFVPLLFPFCHAYV